MEVLNNAGEALERARERLAEEARAEAAEMERKAREVAERPKPLKYVVGAFLAGLLLGALLTVAAFGGIRGFELPVAAHVNEGLR